MLLVGCASGHRLIQRLTGVYVVSRVCVWASDDSEAKPRFNQ